MGKIGDVNSNVNSNLTINDPKWLDEQLNNGRELTPDQGKIVQQQGEELLKTLNTLNTNVAKGDMKAARARVDELKQQFEKMSPDMKEFVYKTLMDPSEKSLGGILRYKLSDFSTNKLLRILNPDHRNNIENGMIKASRVGERQLQEMILKTSLQKTEISGSNE